MRVDESIALAKCKDCNGSGRNGSIGGYSVVCRACDGVGHVFLPVGHVVHEKKSGEK